MCHTKLKNIHGKVHTKSFLTESYFYNDEFLPFFLSFCLSFFLFFFLFHFLLSFLSPLFSFLPSSFPSFLLSFFLIFYCLPKYFNVTLIFLTPSFYSEMFPYLFCCCRHLLYECVNGVQESCQVLPLSIKVIFLCGITGMAQSPRDTTTILPVFLVDCQSRA